MPSQCDMILQALKRGDRLTQLTALDRFGCSRLAARIGELKQAGHAIEDRTIQVARDKHVKEYWLPTGQRKLF